MVPRTTRVSTRGGASADDMVGVLGCASTTRNGLLELEEPKAHMGVCVLNNRNNLTETRRIRTLQVDCSQQPAVRPQGRSGNCVQEGLWSPLRDCTTPDCNSRINVILWYWLVGLRIVSGP